MLRLNINQKTIIPTRDNHEIADGPLLFILSHPFTMGTKKTYLRDIGHIEDLCEFFEIPNYEKRLRYEEGLTRDELFNINIGLQYRHNDLTKLLEAKRSGANVKLLFKQWGSGNQNSAQTTRKRKLVAIQYFEFLMRSGDVCLRNYVCSKDFYDLRNNAFHDISEVIVPPKVYKNQSGAKASLEDFTELEKFMETYDPYKVFKSPDVALRNYVMFGLQFYCGLRIGEVLSLQLKDMNMRERFIRVEDRRDTENDPRNAYAPAVKTYQRPVYVNEVFWKQLEKWREVKLDVNDGLWDLNLKERQNDYLVISLDQRQESYGTPLGIISVHKAYEKLLGSAGLSKIGGSHKLRHLAAMRFVRQRAKDMDWEKIKSDLRYQFGWSETSQMPGHYITHETSRMNYNHMQMENAAFDQIDQSNDGED